jgi:2-methylisocitrate lyase-like PEP mutase family enzyme
MANLREKAETLRKLHQGPRVLVLANAWDVASARVIEAAGASAIASTSAGVAYALGYPDGQRISRTEMIDMVRRIAAAVAVPVSADVEAGYGPGADAAAETARAVIEAGAVGLNLEDMIEPGELLPMEQHVERIRAARAAAGKAGVPLVINGRTDAFAATAVPKADRPAEAIRRANAYLAAGADCAFVPFVIDAEIIARLAREIRGPLNVLGVPGSPPIPELERLGVRRMSVGSGVARAAYGQARRVARELLEMGTYESIAQAAVSYAELQELLARSSSPQEK